MHNDIDVRMIVWSKLLFFVFFEQKPLSYLKFVRTPWVRVDLFPYGKLHKDLY